MKQLLILSYIFLSSNLFGDIAFSSLYDGEYYQHTISDDRLAKCPKWNPEKDLNPPHPAGKALAQAKKYIATIATTEETFWEFEGLALVNVRDGWAWRATYRLTRKGFSSGIWPTMQCWILMDGSLVDPIVTKRHKQKK